MPSYVRIGEKPVENSDITKDRLDKVDSAERENSQRVRMPSLTGHR